ncbi:MAG: RdgB/HAM1 family non-canonical purine NTP pyrophosphatase [Prochlorococcus sp. MED-G73]|uniref:dITP/XTP pyrophosphatase n=2 Tax=Prochlorococcus marinus TaxID=1219 RepID=IXTPA_PROMT|nr:RdgB/HAM1 family non-canonical purine NTP pyrophosphatase [Prochlorococcus marinus]A2C0B3.1 RecName: Full=dITP/XTP pyrophosphatase; AltName: Full=Non-canonical purine NTP pyrophosphatase; AltName: Full=Non-standard purine NTP pyrophosphatase; AltName: Full=Nucleoside-triphosphate diphosphatase; AltName: Full=Nucleoside-triphosphate pyrophosphatase; Short=NTPase [Prochlorococcus marinus str. NATL1A]Q46H95.1 RecName: Full=dITP/XTP pyrophosphatase; AltName: Full=Non-canonical purine NTP pyrophosp
MDNVPLVIASGNKGKIGEFKKLLDDFPIDLLTQPVGFEIEETGSTFMENARIKAIAVSQATGNLSLADDSGLSVEALGGAPGIYSSRYASSDKQRIEKLLAELKPFSNRKAKFECALCIASGEKVLIEVSGFCEGLITFFPKGQNGFGYDPIFEVSGLGETYAEMDHEKKKHIGHRGNAFKLLIPKLKQLLGSMKK